MFCISTKSQVWFSDLLIAVVIFTAMLIVYLRVSSNISDRDERLFDELRSDSVFVADSMSGTGYPDGWNPGNVQKIGLTDGNMRLNLTKVAYAASINSSSLKATMGTRDDFIVFFMNSNDSILYLGSCGFGSLHFENISADECSNVSISSKMLAKSERLVYSNGLVRMVVYSWKK